MLISFFVLTIRDAQKKENIKDAETNLTDKDDKSDIFFSLCAEPFNFLSAYLLL